MLSDLGIQRAMQDHKLFISPFTPEKLGPCSYDLTLDSEYRIYRDTFYDETDSPMDLTKFEPGYTIPMNMNNEHMVDYYGGPGVILDPGMCMLASTQEEVRLSGYIAAEVAGKSSLGRLFQAVHITAGFIDAGFEGKITLEIVNLSPRPVIYRPGMRIAQIIFAWLDDECMGGYQTKGQYQGQKGVQEAKPIKF